MYMSTPMILILFDICHTTNAVYLLVSRMSCCSSDDDIDQKPHIKLEPLDK